MVPLIPNIYTSKCISEKCFFSSHSDLLTCAEPNTTPTITPEPTVATTTLNNSKGQNSRIECDWAYEFLCGDKCLGNGNTCHCGNDSFDFNQAWDNYCCQEPNTSCRNWNGNIYCQGQKLRWNKPCHGSCRQKARRGYTMLPCADQEDCYVGIMACRGKPQCKE